MLKLKKLEESQHRNQSIESILNQKFNPKGVNSALTRNASKKHGLQIKERTQSTDLPPILGGVTNMKRLNLTDKEIDKFNKNKSR